MLTSRINCVVVVSVVIFGVHRVAHVRNILIKILAKTNEVNPD